jgi:glycosyltransferase involved in cell wall biosynthesis
MTEDDYPPDVQTRRVYRWIERQTIEDCQHAVFTTPGTALMYANRYPKKAPSHWSIIANGYDEEDFAEVEQLVGERSPADHRTVLVHSGVLYPSERDPMAFFAALAELCQSGKISASNLQIIFRGSGSEEFYQKQLRQYGIDDIASLAKPIPHHAALAEILRADGLLLFQASNCNHQIPAKAYEYLRARKPIFAMTDLRGDTAALLKSAGVGSIAPLDHKDEIKRGFVDFLEEVRGRKTSRIAENELVMHTRKARTLELARLLESVDRCKKTG